MLRAVSMLALTILLPGTHLLDADTLSAKPLLHERRAAATDLEVGGDVRDIPSGASRFITYSDLLRLPLVTYTVVDDPNFAGAAKITGIPLDQLARALGAGSNATLVTATCYDGYRTTYPDSYIAQHHPLLVLKINGRLQPDWPSTPHGASLAPFLISFPAFTPAFKVLAHSDERLVPFGVVRIDLRDEQQVLGAIAPHGSYPPGSPVMDGYRIAQQNCYRCHNMGAEGGRLAGRDWQMLAMWAATEPQYFARYVKNPQAIDSKDHMPPNPEYDAATIEALRQYFATFAAGGRH